MSGSIRSIKTGRSSDSQQESGDRIAMNTEAGLRRNQTASSPQKSYAISRVFVAIVTRNNAMPIPDGNSFWIVQGEDGKPALAPIQQSLLAVPTNVVLSVSLEDCSGLLLYARNILMPEMTNFSGIQVNVVHTEAVYMTETGQINTEMSLYPTQYIPLSAITMKTDQPEESSSDDTADLDTNLDVEDKEVEEAQEAVRKLEEIVADAESTPGTEGEDAEDVKTEEEEKSEG